MRSSRWHAHGNVYLVAEHDDFTMDPDLDGVVRVLDVDGDDVHVAIVNPDGSTAEMSGNGTRIAAAWLMERTGSDTARVHVGPRVVAVRRADGGLFESDLGQVEVGSLERVDGVELTPVSVGNPHAVVRGGGCQHVDERILEPEHCGALVLVDRRQVEDPRVERLRPPRILDEQRDGSDTRQRSHGRTSSLCSADGFKT